MYTQTDNGIFTITRGDSGYIHFLINEGNSLIPIGRELQANEELYFGLTEPNQPFEFAILRKKFTSSDPPEYVTSEQLGKCFCGQYNREYFQGVACKLNLIPQDTQCLLPGLYYYSLKLKKNTFDEQGKIMSYSVDTIVDKVRFNIVD